MKKLNLTIGQELTINQLISELGVNENLINDDDIRNGKQTNIDNYNGQDGFDIYFDIIERTERGFGVWDFMIKITDIDEL